MKTLNPTLAAVERKLHLLPVFYAVTVVLAVLLGDWAVHAVPHPSRFDQVLDLAEDAVFAVVTGLVFLGLVRVSLRSVGRYRVLAGGTRDLVLFVDDDGRVVDANDAALQAYGWTPHEATQVRLADLVAVDAGTEALVPPSGDVEIPTLVEGVHRRRDGSTFAVEYTVTPDRTGTSPLTMLVARDITGRKRREGIAALLHEVDRAILAGEPQPTLLHRVTSGLAALHPHALVQIGLKGADGTVDILDSVGPGESILGGIQVRWDDTPEGQGPTGTAIRTGRVRVTEFVDAPDLPARLASACARGFTHGIAFPLVARAEVLGAITLFIDARGDVDEREGPVAAILASLPPFADQVALSLLSARAMERLALQSVALNSASEAIALVDSSGVFRWVNPAFTTLTGYGPEDVVGNTPRILKSGKQGPEFYRQMWATLTAGKVWTGEIYNRRRDGTLYLEEQTITPVLGADGAITHFVAIKTDITARRRSEEQARFLALHDVLTGLPNRLLLAENLTRVVHQCRRGRHAALLVVDIDNFKVVNDSLGHAAGDQLLTQTTAVIANVLRPGDFVGRFGGDEFAVIIEDTGYADAAAAAERLRAAFDEFRFAYAGHRLHVSVSIGVTAILGDTDAADLVVQADSALFAAKEQGRNRVVAYRKDLAWATGLFESSRWATRVRDALRDGGLELVYQPVVNLESGAADHHEALLRLRQADGRLVGAHQFLPAAERFGLMPLIDRWVVQRATETIARQDVSVFVNLASVSLNDEGLLEFVERRVRDLGIRPGRLAFEITETTAITDVMTTQRWIRRVKDLGCLFALDDFGVGFSSLAYLRALPVDYVKIDRSFVYDLHVDAVNRALVHAIRTVATTLGKGVIAEGVEHDGQLAALRELGVEHGQGFHWGQPTATPRETAAPAPVAVPSRQGAWAASR